MSSPKKTSEATSVSSFFNGLEGILSSILFALAYIGRTIADVSAKAFPVMVIVFVLGLYSGLKLDPTSANVTLALTVAGGALVYLVGQHRGTSQA